MKIDGTNPLEGRELVNNNSVKDINRKNEAEKADNANKNDDAKDRISVSGRAKEVNELKDMISSLPDIRNDRVEALKKSVETGTYAIDSMKVAEKILEES